MRHAERVVDEPVAVVEVNAAEQHVRALAAKHDIQLVPDDLPGQGHGEGVKIRVASLDDLGRRKMIPCASLTDDLVSPKRCIVLQDDFGDRVVQVSGGIVQADVTLYNIRLGGRAENNQVARVRRNRVRAGRDEEQMNRGGGRRAF